MSLEREVLPDRTEARKESLRALTIAEATHASLAFARRLMTVFGPVVQPRTGFDECVPDVGELGNLGFRRRIAAQLVGHDLARCFSTRGKHPLEKSFGCSLVTALL
ncbi:hypothetical protein LMG28688_06993 [Paraburkholderia caffeinitolerans]|uniref:Uncharacterized protein n=1 Tax=Paraburkholderia caffeinitolerans TaxID=1723730 RepID=A0A6J5GYT5_9BURK|nr:hypothetical protein LMG28688_06993 [Paraburkholderia caffeinitolerans]